MEFYSDGKPHFLEGNVFKLTLPLKARTSDQASDQAGDQASDQAADKTIQDILSFCRTPRSMKEIQDFTGYKHRTHFARNVLNPLISSGQLSLTIPETPTHQNQKYVATRQQNP